MKKKMLIVTGAILLIGLIVVVAYNVYANSFVPSGEVSDKVVFKGLDDNIAVGESYGSVVKKVGGSDNPRLIITVQSGYGGLDKSSIDFESLTSEEIDELLREHRRLLKEQEQKNSGDIAKELGLDYMNITYTYASYAPIIEAEFKSPLTKSDIADIYRIAKHERVLNVTVQLAE